jgi:5-oxoprolinase (ATP-hydrolysing)
VSGTQPHLPWRICVDTGGTFSDCIATAPDGTTCRAKVLSTGALRARILEVIQPRSIRIHESWQAPEGLVTGWNFRKLSMPQSNITVVAHRHDHDSTLLELSELPPIAPGDAIELASPEESPIVGARLLTQTPANQPLPPIQLRLATTRGTNALLERRAGPIAFFVTKGFADLLTIGTQQRPDIFALNIIKPRPLYDQVIEVEGRLNVDGSVLRHLNLDSLAPALDQLRANNIRAAAIALIHSWVNPSHEQALAALLRSRGFDHISCSHEMAAAIKLLPRAQTAVVDAYLAPVIKSYLGNVAGVLSNGSTIHAMTSSGGLVAADSFRPKDSLLSGPAGGVVGAAAAARRSGFTRLISFDMGGTSTDVARYDNDHSYTFEHHVGDAHIVAPAVAVESVAAGGGSVCWLDETDSTLRVGPHSAGASPGPACYGAGGPLTITDCNLLLGRLDPAEFGIPINIEAARAKAEGLRAALLHLRGSAPELPALLEGLIDLADERMAQAIRTISISKGYDPADHVLVAFGGAGGQHACAVAQRLGMKQVLIPQDVGLLSAKGLSEAAIERFAQRQVLRDLDSALPDLTSTLAQLESESRAAVAAQGIAPPSITIRRRILHLRLKGQDTSIPIELADTTPTKPALESTFATEYRSLYGYPPTGRAIEVESVRVIASSLRPTGAHDRSRGRSEVAPSDLASPRKAREEIHRPGGADERTSMTEAQSPRHTQSWFHSHPTETKILSRSPLRPTDSIPGPAIILELHGTTVIPPNWTATLDTHNALLLTHSPTHPLTASSSAVHHELLTARLTSVATDMGETLRAVALSTNVKERLDYSCAILDADAQLVINAPHIPVHLGALGLSVRQVCDAIRMDPGDVVVTNHPAFGGSHLPDITVITPVYLNNQLLAYVASRAHHAEIGGTRPGSMPPDATTLAEEGVVIPPTYLVKSGVSRLDDFRLLITTATHPTRQPDDNLADIQAQIAANHRGCLAIQALAAESGPADLAATMSALTDRAHARTLAALQRFAGQTLAARETLDDGSPIQVSICVSNEGRAAIDFRGSAPTHPGNFNAPLGVIRSAVMYVLRLLIDQPLPLNEGILRAIDLTIPEGMLNPRFDADPTRCPAVAAGNCETSQRVVDTLLKAFGIAACSQGTMNNLIFGNARFGYYETICGGSGATASQPGADAVHTHMTNTRITDPEVLEQRYPVRLERFQVRPDSGGQGHHRGGHGAIREYTFLEPVSISLLTQHRATSPYGTSGGNPGAPGCQSLTLPGGAPTPLASVESRDLPAGSILTIETPGGGGWGPPS